MHHRQEHGSFQGEAEVALSEELLQDGLTAGLAPQAFEEQARTEGTGGEYGHAALGLSGQQHQGLGEACAGDEEGIELAAGLELVEPSECGEDVLAGAAVFPAVFDQLQVGAWAGLLGAEEHGSLWIRDTWKLACFRVRSRSISRWRGTMLLASAGSAPCRQRTCDDSAGKSVEEKSRVPATSSPATRRTACVLTAVSPACRCRATTSAPMSQAPALWLTVSASMSLDTT